MKTPSLLQHHLYWGLGLGAATVATIQILTWLGLGLSNWTWALTWALVVVFAVLAGKSLERRFGARPRFLQALGLLVVMLLLGRLIYQTYMFLYINYVDPNWVDTVAEVWSAQLADSGTGAEEIAQRIAAFRRQWETGFVFTLGLIAYALPEFVLGLLAMIVAVVQPWRKSPML